MVLMDTVRYVEREGYQIVTGFDTLRVDPMATANKVKELIAAEGMPSEVTEAQERLADLWSQYELAKETSRDVPEALAVWQRKYDDANAANAAAQEVLLARIRRLRDEHPVYMHVRRGEILLPVSDLERLQERAKTLEPGEALLVNGDVIPCLLGTIYYIRDDEGALVKHSVNWIGQGLPDGARRAGDLTAAEERELAEAAERARVAALTPEQLDREREHMLSSVRAHAVNKRSQFEIEGMAPGEALDAAREWLAERTREIKSKYA